MRRAAVFNPGGEIEFLRKRNNKNLYRKKKIRSIKLKGFHIFLLVLFFMIIALGVFKMGKFITEWEVLSVKSFKLVNPPHYMKHKVRDILKSFGGNILTINLKELRRKLIGIGEIRDVNISRKLPSTLQIDFFLRKPVFQIRDGKIVKLIDREGVIVNESKSLQPDLILIKDGAGINLGELNSGLTELSKIRRSIEYISYKNPYGLVLKLKRSKELFYTGEKNFIPKLKKFFKLEKKLVLNGNRIKAVDLRFKDRFYLEFERGCVNEE